MNWSQSWNHQRHFTSSGQLSFLTMVTGTIPALRDAVHKSKNYFGSYCNSFKSCPKWWISRRFWSEKICIVPSAVWELISNNRHLCTIPWISVSGNESTISYMADGNQSHQSNENNPEFSQIKVVIYDLCETVNTKLDPGSTKLSLVAVEWAVS